MSIRISLMGSCAVLMSASIVVAQSTTRVSVGSGGTQGSLQSNSPSISTHGRYVAFDSFAPDLVASDTNGTGDVFLHDRVTNVTQLLSVDSNGVQGNDESFVSSIAADGTCVVFESLATNLVPNDTNGVDDVFIRDLSTNTTERVSVDSFGNEGNGPSYGPGASHDGRYIVFASSASNLVLGDNNGAKDIFVRDRLLGQTIRVDVDSNGVEANLGAQFAWISDDGRHVAFESLSTNLASGDTNGVLDIFVRDLDHNTTTRVSVDSNGVQANGVSTSAAISANGRFVVFGSVASNLAPGDTNGDWDVFVHDLFTGQTERVSVASDGTGANHYSPRGTISADGRYVAFKSNATNLVPNDTNNASDIFVRDRRRGLTVRVSVSSSGAQANGDSSRPMISADGRHIAFYSYASNLVSGDTNANMDAFVNSFGPIF